MYNFKMYFVFFVSVVIRNNTYLTSAVFLIEVETKKIKTKYILTKVVY